ncbi:hypothetical protein D9757_000205 [Collybiopsis confluens]|uniref:Uncharacterized protein n=1 Tax=Collybiopsis confluens TaxID=2823264 RepID=A0A8H5I6F0_9AGAR|nr:hypothetical protein D9757_000205 [Collybiopsis confluens]
MPRQAATASPSSGTQKDRLIHDLGLGIQADEASSRILLQAFDIDNDVQLGRSSRAKPPQRTPFRQISNTLRTNSDTPAFISPRPSRNDPENSFFNPLRDKHFLNLSPTILRHLLRSPSPCADTHNACILSEFNDVGPCHKSMGDVFSSSAPSAGSSLKKSRLRRESSSVYPPTPPLTARIPNDLFMSTPDSFCVENTEVDSVPDITACLSSMTPYAECHPTNRFTPQHDATIPAARSFTLLSSATRLSLCVADEIRAGGETADERRAFLLSLLQSSSRLDESYPVISNNNKHTRPSTLLSPTQSPDHRRSHKPGRILQREFVALLEKRALEEERQAKELVKLAKRLEKLAVQRRQLAAVVLADTK